MLRTLINLKHEKFVLTLFISGGDIFPHLNTLSQLSEIIKRNHYNFFVVVVFFESVMVVQFPQNKNWGNQALIWSYTKELTSFSSNLFPSLQLIIKITVLSTRMLYFLSRSKSIGRRLRRVLFSLFMNNYHFLNAY